MLQRHNAENRTGQKNTFSDVDCGIFASAIQADLRVSGTGELGFHP